MDTLLFSCKTISTLVKNAVDGCRVIKNSSSDLRFVDFILFYANRDFSQFTQPYVRDKPGRAVVVGS